MDKLYDAGWCRLPPHHSKVSAQLPHHPRLVNSGKYLDKHDDLEKYLHRRPGVTREILNQPG